ncbi:MAG: WD40 repeat domain-containing protein, partial [Pirellulales bacterium]
DGELFAPGSSGCRAMIPISPEGSYELAIELTPNVSNHGLHVLLPTGSSNTMLTLVDETGQYGGLERLNRRDLQFSELRRSAAAIAAGRRSIIQVAVKLKGADVEIDSWVDDTAFVTWRGPQTALSDPGGDWSLPLASVPGFGAAEETIFHSVRLRSLSGESKPADRTAAHQPRSVSAQVRTTLTPPGAANCLAFSPDGQYLAAGCRDSWLRIWGIQQKHAELASAVDHTRAVTGVAFSPDGTTLVSCSDDRRVVIRKLADFESKIETNAHTEPVRNVSFSADGGLIASAGTKTEIHIWDAATGRPVQSLSDPDAALTCAVFAPLGDSLATASGAISLRIWNAKTGQQQRSLQPVPSSGNCLAFLKGRDILAIGAGRDGVQFSDFNSGVLLSILASGQSAVTDIASTHDGSILAVAGSRGGVQIWDTDSRRELMELTTGPQAVQSVRFSPGGRVLAAALNNGQIKLWNLTFDPPLDLATLVGPVALKTATEPAARPVKPVDAAPPPDYTVVGPIRLKKDLAGHEGEVHCVTFARNGRLLASAGADKSVRLWDVLTEKQLKAFNWHTDRVIDVAFSPDSKWLASASEDKTVRIWDLANGVERHSLTGHGDAVYCVGFSPDGTIVASGSKDKKVIFWSSSDGAKQKTFTGHQEAVKDLDFSADGRVLASAGFDTTVKLWDPHTTNVHTEVAESSPLMAVCFAPIGAFATGSLDQKIRIRDGRTTKMIREITGHTLPIRRLEFSLNNRVIIAAAGSAGTPTRQGSGQVIFWSAATGKQLARIDDPKNTIFAASVSPDGNLLATSDSAGRIRLWELNLAELK